MAEDERPQPPGPLESFAMSDIDARIMLGQPTAYLGAFGAEADDELALRRETTRHRFPPSTHYRTYAGTIGCIPASEDSPLGQSERLRLIGRTRGLDRYPGETDTSYCERLAIAFPTHLKAGTPNAIIDQLHAFGFVDALVFEEYAGGFYAEPTDEYGWRFVVVVGPDHGALWWPGAIVGTAIVGTTVVGLGVGTTLQLAAIKRLIVQWKQAFALPLRFVIVFGAAPIVGLAIVDGAIVGGGQTTEVLMADPRTVGCAIVGEAPLWGLNL
jgi:hypothetical protein